MAKSNAGHSPHRGPLVPRNTRKHAPCPRPPFTPLSFGRNNQRASLFRGVSGRNGFHFLGDATAAFAAGQFHTSFQELFMAFRTRMSTVRSGSPSSLRAKPDTSGRARFHHASRQTSPSEQELLPGVARRRGSATPGLAQPGWRTQSGLGVSQLHGSEGQDPVLLRDSGRRNFSNVASDAGRHSHSHSEE